MIGRSSSDRPWSSGFLLAVTRGLVAWWASTGFSVLIASPVASREEPHPEIRVLG